MYSENVWESRLSEKFGPNWKNLSKQLVESETENNDLSKLYNQLIGQCSSKIKKCEVCDNWSIVKGDQDHENAHWEGKITEVTSSNLLGKFHGEREVMIFKSLLTAEGRVCKFCYKAKVSFCLSVNQLSVNQKKC